MPALLCLPSLTERDLSGPVLGCISVSPQMHVLKPLTPGVMVQEMKPLGGDEAMRVDPLWWD